MKKKEKKTNRFLKVPQSPWCFILCDFSIQKCNHTIRLCNYTKDLHGLFFSSFKCAKTMVNFKVKRGGDKNCGKNFDDIWRKKARTQERRERVSFFPLPSLSLLLFPTFLSSRCKGPRVRGGAVHQRQLVTPLGIGHKFHSVM